MLTVTVTIDDPETEARMRAAADAHHGGSVEKFLIAAGHDAVNADPDALTPEEAAEIRAGIRRGFEAAEAGRLIPFAEWAGRKREKYGLRPAAASESAAP